jgi:hypothetical protein
MKSPTGRDLSSRVYQPNTQELPKNIPIYDIYTLFAAEMFGVPPEEVTKEQRKEAKKYAYEGMFDDLFYGNFDNTDISKFNCKCINPWNTENDIGIHRNPKRLVVITSLDGIPNYKEAAARSSARRGNRRLR